MHNDYQVTRTLKKELCHLIILDSAFGSSHADKYAIVNAFKSLKNICFAESKVTNIRENTKKIVALYSLTLDGKKRTPRASRKVITLYDSP